MKPKFIFDLSEVLIMGLLGIQKPLSPMLNIPENKIMPFFAGPNLQSLCRGEISEDIYLQNIVEAQQWQVPLETLKKSIRENFHREVAGTFDIVEHLAKQYEVILLSDHAVEWVAYIKTVHSFFDIFDKVFFSYELGSTKEKVETFEKVLQAMNYEAQDCWLVDDSAKNIAVAERAGIHGIQFMNADQLQTALKENGLW
jgi:FMN phosphatase YigB (HAD superfamily)